MFEDLLALWEEADHLIFAGIAITAIVGICAWAKGVPARLKKRWHTKTVGSSTAWRTWDGESGGYSRRPKNWKCAFLLFLGFNHSSLWKERKY